MKTRSKRQVISRTKRRSNRSKRRPRAQTTTKTVLKPITAAATPASIADGVRSGEERKHYPIPWRVFLGKSTNELATIQENALHIVAESAQTAVAISQYLFGSANQSHAA